MQRGLRAPALAVALSLVGAAAPGRAQALDEAEQRTLQEYLEVVHLAREYYGAEVSHRDLFYSGIQGMLRTLDPHTSFLTPESYEAMRRRQQGSFFGLGMLVSRRNGRLTVISPIEGTPAFRLGLRSGDVIQAIEDEPTDLMSLDEAVSRLKGPKGTEVRITIARPGLDELFDLTVTRAEIPQNTVRYAYMLTPEVGYLRLTDFSRSTGREMTEAIERLRGEGMKKLLLDLRNNGGGLLDQAIAVSDLFLPARSLIVATRGRLTDSHQEYLDSEDEPDPELALPLVVLVNRGTASAAEILAGAIQDHDVGLVVGTQTWGKGLVQTVYNLSYGTGISLTTAKYHTPSGRVIQRDYTSYYDYYADLAAAGDGSEPAGAPDRPEFFTDLGRTVYGGGGITPDVVVELPDGPTVVQPLYRYNAFFDFAIDYHQRHPEIGSGWSPGDELVDEFVAWLETRDLPVEGLDEGLSDPGARDFVRRQIHSDVFTAAFGTEAAHRVLAVGDPQIQSGLEQFDRAAEMLDRRRQPGAAGERGARPEASAPDRRPPSTVAVPAPRPEYWPAELQAAERFASAKLLAGAGAFEEATAAYRESLALDDSGPYAFAELAEFLSYLAQLAPSAEKGVAKLEAAAGEAEKALALAPEDPAILSTFARIHLRLGEHRVEALELAREAYESLRQKTTGDLQVLTSLGQIYLWQKQPELAAEVLQEARRYRPGHRLIQGMLVDALSEAGDVEGAEEALTDIVRRRPSDPGPLLTLTDLYSERGDHARAVETLRAAPATVRRRARVRRALARQLHLAGHDDEALAIVDELLAEDESPGLDRLRVSVLVNQLRYEEAIDGVARILAADATGGAQVRETVLLARLLERVGRSEEAAETLEALARDTPDAAPDVHLSLAGVLERQGAVEEAAALLRRELDRVPVEKAASVGRALIRVLLDSGRPAEALAVADELTQRTASADPEIRAMAVLEKLAVLGETEQWDRVVELAPTLGNAPSARLQEVACSHHAEALSQLGRLAEALVSVERCAESLGSRSLRARGAELLYANDRADEGRRLLDGLVSTGTPEDLLLAARVHQRGERWEDAIDLLERVLEQDPKSLQARFELGASSERAGRRDRAAELFRGILAFEPDHAPSLNYLGYMWAEQGENLEEALRLLRRTVALEPDNGAYVDSLGWAYFQLGRHEEARRFLEWAARLLPDDPTILEHLGDVYVGIQEPGKARSAYLRVLETRDGDPPDAVRRKLEALEE